MKRSEIKKEYQDTEDLYNFHEYMEQIKELSATTINVYMIYYKYLDITKINNQEYIMEFCTKHGNNSVIRGMLLNYLEFKGLKKIIDLPPKPTGRKPKKMPRYITPQEIQAIINYGYSKNFKRGLLFDIIYQGALRCMEVKGITLGDFNWQGWIKAPDKFCELRVHGKGKKERVVLINPETMNKLFQFLINKNMPESEFYDTTRPLFLTRTAHKPPEKNNIWKLIKNAGIKAIGRDVRPHELRHIRAKDLETKGINVKDIKNYLGHSSLVTTEIYLHTTTEESIKNIKAGLKNEIDLYPNAQPKAS